MNINQLIKETADYVDSKNRTLITTEDLLIVMMSKLNEYNILDFDEAIEFLEEYQRENFERTPLKNIKKMIISQRIYELQEMIESSPVAVQNTHDVPLTVVMTFIASSEIDSMASILSKRLIGSDTAKFEKLISAETEKIPDFKFNINSFRDYKEDKRQTTNERKTGTKENRSALECFGIDLSERERRNPLIGREKEMQRVIEVLLKKDKPNPILTGSQGVGKTAVVQELAIRIKEENVPKAIKDTVRSIYSIEVADLLAGSKYRGEFEGKLKAVLEEVKNSDRSVILYIDEIHTIMGAGANPDNPVDAANILKPYLTNGTIRIIGSTTTDEYRKFIERDKALAKGVKVDFTNTVIIMTSNAGAASIVKKNVGFGKSSETLDISAMDKALEERFPPEFRGRLTDVVKFNDLTPEISEMIVKKEIAALADSLTKKNVKLTVTDSCIEHLAEIGYTPMTGARNIKNLVSKEISELIVDDMLFGKLKNGGSIKIDWLEKNYRKTIRTKKTI